MAFRLFRRFRIAPGLTLNLSKSGLSVSAGPRGAKITVGPRGIRQTVGLPGTGIHYTNHTGYSRKQQRSQNRPAMKQRPDIPTPESLLSLSLLRRALTSSEDLALIDGTLAVLKEDDLKALEHYEKAPNRADAGFMGGIISIRNNDFKRARDFLDRAYSQHAQLGSFFKEYGLTLDLEVHLTPELRVPIEPNEKGVLLLLTEIYQKYKMWDATATCLRRLMSIAPDDLTVKLSSAEFFVEVYKGSDEAYHRVLKLTEGIENVSELHAALLLYKARALSGLGLFTAARDTLTQALRRKKGRSHELLLALSYERALVYERLGRHRQARGELEKIYVQNPEFEDVANRLGLK